MVGAQSHKFTRVVTRDVTGLVLSSTVDLPFSVHCLRLVPEEISKIGIQASNGQVLGLPSTRSTYCTREAGTSTGTCGPVSQRWRGSHNGFRYDHEPGRGTFCGLK
jgi:hypothetical protein